ncbi:MAG: glycogen synthase [Brevinema sp.]
MAKKQTRVLFTAGEAVPFAKVGGLADVVSALAKALTKEENFDVRIMIPKYRSVGEFCQENQLKPRNVYSSTVSVQGESFPFRIEEVVYNDICHYFIDCPCFFDRPNPYNDPETGKDYSDNLKRFVFFSKSLFEACKTTSFIPNIIHCHDWHMGLVALYKHALVEYSGIFANTHTAFTIHNLSYQGIFSIDQYPMLDIDWKYFSLNGLEYYRNINLLKGGIVFSEAVNTVSKTYAQEIETEEYGAGLEGVIQEKKFYGAFQGIMNGVDYSEWSPAVDIHLTKDFGLNYDFKTIKNKEKIRQAFAITHGLQLDDTTPLIGMITRLFDQKGMDIVFEILEDLLRTENLAFAILGTGKREYEEKLKDMAQRYPQKLFIHIGFHTPLSHHIEAASDLFLMPSSFEPSGLNQLYSMKYGTLPIVRKTGGLADSVRDMETGFVFENYHPDALREVILRACSLWRTNKPVFTKMIKTAMSEDWSWKRSAKGYYQMYKKLLKKDH